MDLIASTFFFQLVAFEWHLRLIIYAQSAFKFPFYLFFQVYISLLKICLNHIKSL